jgi:hypothetical protein
MPDLTKPRRFPPPWSVEDKDTYFIVRDHNGQDLAYVYAEDKRTGVRPLTRDEARRIAGNVAKLPELVRKPDSIAPAPLGQLSATWPWPLSERAYFVLVKT